MYGRRMAGSRQPAPADASSRLVQGLRDIRDNATYLHFERTRPVDKPNRRGASAAPCEDCPRRR